MFLVNRFGMVAGSVANGLLWGAAWGAIGLAGLSVMMLAGLAPRHAGWLNVVILSTKFGILGVPSGIAFSLLMVFVRRRKGLQAMNLVKAGILGALFAAIFIPLFLQLMNVVADGHTIAWRLVLDDSVWAAVFGAVAAVVTLKLARRPG